MKDIFYLHCMMACLFIQACNSSGNTILSKESTVIDTVAINHSMVINDSIAINNAVPNAVIDSKDSFLQMHQDTVFFQNKKFSGTIFNLYPNGDTSMIAHYFSGLEQGLLKKMVPQ